MSYISKSLFSFFKNSSSKKSSRKNSSSKKSSRKKYKTLKGGSFYQSKQWKKHYISGTTDLFFRRSGHVRGPTSRLLTEKEKDDSITLIEPKLPDIVISSKNENNDYDREWFYTRLHQQELKELYQSEDDGVAALSTMSTIITLPDGNIIPFNPENKELYEPYGLMLYSPGEYRLTLGALSENTVGEGPISPNTSLWTEHVTAGTGKFKKSVFICEKAIVKINHHLTNTPNDPVMLVHKDDWEWLQNPAVTHPGAFGNDYAKILSIKGLPVLDTNWYAIWKFPYDMFKYMPMLPFGVPVGTYNLRPDFITKESKSNAKVPLNSAVTKYRASNDVHELIHKGTGNSVAMISSSIFLGNLNFDLSISEKELLKKIISELKTQCGINVISCVGQHHALVFYTTTDDKLITPQIMCNLLQTKPEIMDILQHFTDRDIYSWAFNYIETFNEIEE
jgi:hypothetical protein